MDIIKLSEEVENVSLIYANKFKIKRDPDWFILKLQEELGELIQSYLVMAGRGRRKEKSNKEMVQDFRSEVADVFSHVLPLAKHHNVNLEKEVNNKWLVWNKSKQKPKRHL